MGYFITELKVGLFFFLSQNFVIGNIQYSLVDSGYLITLHLMINDLSKQYLEKEKENILEHFTKELKVGFFYSVKT